jgi:hypothetical protein
MVDIKLIKKEEEIRNKKEKMINRMNMVLGKKKKINIKIEGIKNIYEKKKKVVIYVKEKSVKG